MSEHTKGNWSYNRALGKHEITTDTPSQTGNYIAETYGDSFEESEANAKLIAAAPEMLEALEKVMLWSSHNWTAQQSKAFIALNELVQAAIKKATF